MSVSLTLKNISRSYVKDNEKFYAVQNVNLEVQPGEFLTFLGPSGLRQDHDSENDCRL